MRLGSDCTIYLPISRSHYFPCPEQRAKCIWVVGPSTDSAQDGWMGPSTDSAQDELASHYIDKAISFSP